MQVARKNLMGVHMNANDVPWERLVEFGAPNTPLVSPIRTMQPPPEREAVSAKQDFTMVRFFESASREDIVRFARTERVRLATPQECLAVGRECPWLASELELRSFVLIAPRVCRFQSDNVEDGLRYEPALDAERCLVGIRYVIVPSTTKNHRIAHPYWFEDAYPESYWFLFADRTPHLKESVSREKNELRLA